MADWDLSEFHINYLRFMDQHQALLLILDTKATGGGPPAPVPFPPSIISKLFARYEFDEGVTLTAAGRVAQVEDMTGEPLNTMVPVGSAGQELIFDDVTFVKPVVRTSRLYPFDKYEAGQRMNFFHSGESFFISILAGFGGPNVSVANFNAYLDTDPVAQTDGASFNLSGSLGDFSGLMSDVAGGITTNYVGSFGGVDAALGLQHFLVVYDAAAPTDNLKLYLNGALHEVQTIPPFSNVEDSEWMASFFNQDFVIPYQAAPCVVGSVIMGASALTDLEISQLDAYYNYRWSPIPTAMRPVPFKTEQAISNSATGTSRALLIPNDTNLFTGHVCVLFVSIFTPFSGTTYSNPPPAAPTVAGFTLIDSVPMSDVTERVATYAFYRILTDDNYNTSIEIDKSADITYAYVYVDGIDLSNPVHTGAAIGKYSSGAATTMAIVYNPTFEAEALSIAYGAWKANGTNSTTSDYFVKTAAGGTFQTLYEFQNYKTAGVGPFTVDRGVAGVQAKGILIQLRRAA